MDPKPEDLAEFFRTRKIGFGRCLEPTMQCGEPAIRAHSIQNRQTIALPNPPPKSVGRRGRATWAMLLPIIHCRR